MELNKLRLVMVALGAAVFFSTAIYDTSAAPYYSSDPYFGYNAADDAFYAGPWNNPNRFRPLNSPDLQSNAVKVWAPWTYAVASGRGRFNVNSHKAG